VSAADADAATAATATTSGRRFRSSAWLRSGLAFWSSAADAPRLRRPSDVALLVISSAVLVLMLVPAPGPTSLDKAVSQFLSSLPGTFGWLWETLYATALAWAIVLMLAALLTRHRRIVFVEQLAGVVLALGIGGVMAVVNGSTWGDVWQALITHSSPTVFPAIRLCVVAAVVGVSAVHLARPHRRVGVWITILGATGALALQIDSLLGASAGLVLGVAAGAAVHLAFGSPGGHAPIELLRDEVSDLGIDSADLQYVKEDRAVVARGTDGEGRAIKVRVYGRDAWEGSLFASLWDRLWYRRAGSITTVGRQVQAEHEAFLSLLAERGGAAVQPVLAAGTAWGRDALLVRLDEGTAFEDLPEGSLGEAQFRAAWESLASVHSAGLAHGAVSLSTLSLLDDGRVLLSDLSSGTTAPEEGLLAADRAHLLVASAVVLGIDGAVALAHDALGEEKLVGCVAFLQPPAFEPDERKAVKAAGWKWKALREAVVASTGAEPPPLEKLRRVNIATVAMMLVIVVVAYTLIGAIAGVGWSNLVAEFQGANWWWILAGVLLAVFIYVGQAIAMQGAAIDRLPFVPVLGLEMSIAFLGLAVPSSAAKVGMTIRFLQLVGSNPTAAVAISLIDSLSGFIVQALVIVLTLFTGVVTLQPSQSGSGPQIGSTLAGLDWGLIGFIVLVLIVVAVLAIRFVPKVRTFVAARTAESRQSLQVFRSGRKVAQIAAGSVMWNVIAAGVLWCSLAAFGESATFAELILINTLVALFAGLMPIPGNVGVMEAALTAGLMAIGIDQTAAMSTAIAYRLATYFVPPFYGYASLSIMRGKGYL
jgi:uncharacterized membrane protein YbhN (UPF0104 family)